MKNLMKFVFVAVFVAVAGYGVYTSQKSDVMSDLALANVEALADCEHVSYDTSYQDYKTESHCRCLACVEIQATNCNCSGSGPL